MIEAKLAVVLVAAAISLKAPLEDAALRFGAVSPGEPITFTFGSSGQLAAQIEQGAPVDLFVAASPVDMERVAAAGRIDSATRVAIAGNRLVVVVPRGQALPVDLAGLVAPRFARVAVGNPKTVPAGRYAREALYAAGVLDAIDARFVYAENVRQVVDIVARGEADAGIVYATDVALGGEPITSAFEIPEPLHTPILYEGAVVVGAAVAARARAFLRFLTSSAGRDSLAKYGFLPPRSAATK
jgi:molybdate transport system substrate-binding protein